MDIPITGYEGNNAGGLNHSHNLYITRWNGNPSHIHQISGRTSSDLAHYHIFVGTTDPSPNGIQHTHHYFMYTSVDDGHIHEIRGFTGPAIYLPNGEHYHEFQGVTTVNGLTPHSHSYRGVTSG